MLTLILCVVFNAEVDKSYSASSFKNVFKKCI